MEEIIRTEDLPKDITLMYNMPDEETEAVAKAPLPSKQVAGDILPTEGLPSDAELLYNNPSDLRVAIPQQEVKKVAKDPAITSKNTTLGGYIGTRLNNWVDAISEDYQESVRQSTEAFSRSGAGKQTYAETALQITGDTFNLLADAIGETVIQIAGTAGDTISFLVPDDVEEPIKEGFKATWNSVLNSPAGQAGLTALSEGMDSWNEFETNNPRMAENIKSVVEIGMFVSPTKAAPIKTAREKVGTAIEKAGTKMRVAGINKDAAIQGKKLGSDVRYLDSMSNVKSKGYMDRTRSVDKKFTQPESDAVAELKKLRQYNPTAKTAATINKNHIVVDNALSEAKALRDDLLDTYKGNLNASALYSRTATAMDDVLRNSPDPDQLGRVANGAYAEMERLIAKEGTTPRGIDAVRQGMNDWMKLHSSTQQVDKVVGAINRELRATIDDAVEGYAEAQAKVSGLTAAKIGIGNKLETDAGNAMLNYLDSALKSVGLSRDVAFLVSAASAGAASYATSSLPILLAGGAVIGGFKLKSLVAKGLSKGQAEKMLGTMQQITGQAIKGAKGDTKVIKEIRARHQALVEVIKTAQENYNREQKEDEDEDMLKITVTKPLPKKED